MVDPRHPQAVERSRDGRRLGLLAGMGDRAQAQRPGSGECGRERFGREADLARVQAPRPRSGPATARSRESGVGRLGGEMAEEREDQAARDAVLALAVGEAVEDAANHVLDRDARAVCV